MLYVGTGLGSVLGYGTEPALIDPELRVSAASADRGGMLMGYWPSYSEIAPECRSVYLDWLAAGRSDPNVSIGYVFLFLYGLERRVLFDAPLRADARAELPLLRAEVARLLDLYGGGSRSFRGYASRLLDVLEALLGRTSLTGSETTPPATQPGDGVSIRLRLGLARFAATGTPLPSEWALAWLRADPRSRLRSPAHRCPTEFDELFQIRYAQAFGPGLVLPTGGERIRLSYKPASASFGSRTFELPLDEPDVTSLWSLHRKLADLASACMDDLGSYSRWVLKNDERRDSLNALALLPAELAQRHGAAAIAQIQQTLDEVLGEAQGGVFESTSLLGHWIDGDLGRLGKRESVQLAQLLAQAGFGLEPDVRFGGPPLAQATRVAVFRQACDPPEVASDAYHIAALLVQLAVTVSAADGEVSREEEDHLREHLGKALHLDAGERQRLANHLHWLLAEPPSLAGIHKRLEPLSAEQRREAALFLVRVAWADGTVDPKEVRCLTRIYQVLGLDPACVHDDLHRVGLDAGQDDDSGPVLVRPAEATTAPGFAIPERAAPEPTPLLDQQALQAKLVATAAVSSLLAGIFADAPEPTPADLAPAEGSLHGLSPSTSHLLRRLGERPSWARHELEALAGDLGLLLDGALEALNELAFARCDDPLWEGEDSIDIDLSIHQELTR